MSEARESKFAIQHYFNPANGSMKKEYKICFIRHHHFIVIENIEHFLLPCKIHKSISWVKTMLSILTGSAPSPTCPSRKPGAVFDFILFINPLYGFKQCWVLNFSSLP